MPRRTRFSSGTIAAAIGLGLGVAGTMIGLHPAAATVITPPPDGCSQSRDIGQVELDTEYLPPADGICTGIRAGRLKISAMTAGWAPSDLPFLIVIKRDRSGYRLYMTSMLSDRRRRPLCWSEEPAASAHARSPAALWAWVGRSFDRWASACAPLSTIGLAEAKRTLAARQFEFERGFAHLARLSPARFGSPDDVIGVGSFLPRRISQRLLDAIADACEGPRERLKLLADRTIAWTPDQTLPSGADGSRPFDTCVDDQIRYLPGYPK